MQKLPKILEQTGWQILGKGVTSLSTFIILGLVARIYGPNGTGVFTLALTYLAIFYLLGDFGFNAHALRQFNGLTKSQISRDWRKLLGTRILWSMVLVVLAVALLLFWPFSTPEFNRAVIFGSLAIIASSVFITCNLIFQGELKYNLSVLASSLGTLISLAIFIFLSFAKYPVSILLIAHLLGWVAIALTALLLVHRFVRQIVPLFDFNYAVKLFKESWPIAATLSLNVLYFRADSFMVAYYKSISDAGVYNAAYSVFQSALVLPTFIMNAYYPMMLKSLNKVKLVGMGLLGLSVTGTIFTLIFAPLIIKILTGGGFAGSALSLQILSLGFPAYFLSSLLMWMLVAKNKYKSLFFLYTLGLIFNLVLNFIYIPKYSFFAASWITVISEYLILVMQIMVLLFERSENLRGKLF